MKLTHHHEPWEYMEIEDFLPTHKFEKIQELAQRELERYHIEGVNTPRGKYINFIKEDIIPEATELFDFLPRRDSTGTLKKLLHWTITPAGVNYPTHIDNKSRLSTVTFYVAPKNNVGTIICTNPSTNDDGDHGPPDLPTVKEAEVEWQPNKVFLHCGGSTKWHRFSGGDNTRITLSCFLVQPDLIAKGRDDLNYLLDLDERS
tara:strand:- start:665 stop:1273 length:609 start_codon:yes stop_codon:yes gene_type:complete